MGNASPRAWGAPSLDVAAGAMLGGAPALDARRRRSRATGFLLSMLFILLLSIFMVIRLGETEPGTA